MTRVLTSTGPLRKALVLSFAVHCAIYGFTRPVAARLTAPAATLAPADDRWTGTTADLPFAGAPSAVYDVTVDARPAVAPIPEPALPAVIAVPAAVAAPRPAAPVAVAPPASVQPPRPKRKPRPQPSVAAPSSGDSPGAAPGASGGGTFGAEGSASVRDLGRAFTRAIPPASVADPAWASLPTGDTRKMEIAIRVDDTGHIRSAEPRGIDAPQVLVNVLRRTVALLEAGTFAVRPGGAGEGTEILELRARISDTSSEGIPTGLAHEYEGGRGKAWFTQTTGRHVEVFVRVVKVER
jgi:hypothetical protein